MQEAGEDTAVAAETTSLADATRDSDLTET